MYRGIDVSQVKYARIENVCIYIGAITYVYIYRRVESQQARRR